MAQPWNLGPPIADFSGLANLGNSFFGAYDKASKQRTLADLGKDIQSGNYAGAAQKALAGGDLETGLGLLKLGQADKDRAADAALVNGIFGGGSPAAAPSAPGAPVVPGTASLIQNESGGNWQAQNNAVGAGGQTGHFGRAQFGQARLQEAQAAGAIPPGTTPQQFMQSPELQQRAEQWHFNDIDQSIKANGFDRLVGQSLNGVPVTVEGMRAVAHLGGKEGLRKFIETGGRYNPADVNGTRLSDYFARHGGGDGAQVAAPIAPVQQAPLAAPGVQVAENEDDVARLEAAQGAPNVQIAQTGAPTADAPAPGAANAQFVIPGTNTTVDQETLANNPRIMNMTRMLAAAKGESTKAAISKRLELEIADAKSRQESNKPTDVQRNYNLARQQGYQGTLLDYQKELRTQINNTNTNQFDAKGETKFNEALGTAQAKRWNDYIAEGDVAQGRIADIQTLRETSRRLGSQGSQANMKALIGPYAESLGIPIEGLSDIQLYDSIVQRLAPTLRVAGSGSQSDIEFKGLVRAVGPLSNHPAAREMIFDTFESASRNDLARAAIASRLAAGEINRGDAEKELRALPNPLEAFREFRKANPDLVGQAIKDTALRASAEKRDPVKVTSPEEARKLPSGTRIILPDGRPGQVP